MNTKKAGNPALKVLALLCAAGLAVLAGRTYQLSRAPKGTVKTERAGDLPSSESWSPRRGKKRVAKRNARIARTGSLKEGLRIQPGRADLDPAALQMLMQTLVSQAVLSGPAQAEESPEQRSERHKRMNERITSTLGNISEEKRALLLDLNDDATEVDRGLKQDFLQGKLTQEQYVSEYRQAKLDQLDQLEAVVTKEEYKRLTGLKPGVDPFEYVKTGVGRAENPRPPANNEAKEPSKRGAEPPARVEARK